MQDSVSPNAVQIPTFCLSVNGYSYEKNGSLKQGGNASFLFPVATEADIEHGNLNFSSGSIPQDLRLSHEQARALFAAIGSQLQKTPVAGIVSVTFGQRRMAGAVSIVYEYVSFVPRSNGAVVSK